MFRAQIGRIRAKSNSVSGRRYYADDAALPLSSREGLLAATNAIHKHFELELIQTQMAQKPMLRAEVGMRVRCANKASAE